MLAKFGFVIVVVLCGVFSFVAGVLSPESVRQPVVTMAEKIVSKNFLRTAQTDAAKNGQNLGEAAPISYSELLIPTPLPVDGRYALQLGLYPNAQSTETQIKNASTQGVPAIVIPIVDQSGERWFVVAAGQYSSPDSARNARVELSRELELTQALPAIRLPAKLAASPTAP